MTAALFTLILFVALCAAFCIGSALGSRRNARDAAAARLWALRYRDAAHAHEVRAEAAADRAERAGREATATRVQLRPPGADEHRAG
jgi:hypothetical protein